MTTSNTDLLILGGGTGGYVAAIKAAQAGLEVVLVEKDKLGGTCLHRGCIPTKALLRSAELFNEFKAANEFGLELAGEVKVDFAKIQARKNKITSQLHKGVESLMKKNKIRVIKGQGIVMGPSIFSPVSGAVIVTDEAGQEEVIIPKKLIIATGSKPKSLPNIPFDEEYILSSDGLLEMETLPKSMAIIGGGVIGCEFASFLNSLGVEVTIFEFAERLLITESKAVSKLFTQEISKKGITVRTQAQVESAKVVDQQVAVQVKGDDTTLHFDRLLVAVGRQANVDSIGLQNTSIKFDQKGIQVNEHYQTAEDHIYAIGDCIPSMQLAHVAMKEGELAIDHILTGKNDSLDYNQIPRCTYASPEIASVGYHKDNVPASISLKVGNFPFAGNGKALIHGDAIGFAEVLRDAESDDLIGVSMIGPQVTNLLSEVSTAMYLNASPLEVGQAVHAHPTLSEVIQEASLDAYQKAVHK